ncbi:MAG: hypothetical protein J5750_08335, partial [Clostridiales bacterium]|nr:hypothetical protein [Clostridiales bacterium]
MENKEIQIKLSDILASFLKSILPIVLITFLCGAFLGCFGIYRARKTKADPSIQSTINALKKDIASKEDSKKHIENSNSTILDVTIPYLERKVEVDKALMESRSIYLDESIYCSIDPFNCGVSRISFTIDVPVPGDAKEEYAQYRSAELSRLVNACTRMYPLSDTSMARVRAMIDVSAEAKYIDELVSITGVNDEMVVISVFYTDPAIAKEVVDYLFDQISSELRELSPDCIISVVSTYTGTEVNWEMNTTQINHQNSILTADKNLSTDQDSISQAYKTYDENSISIETIDT